MQTAEKCFGENKSRDDSTLALKRKTFEVGSVGRQ